MSTETDEENEEQFFQSALYRYHQSTKHSIESLLNSGGSLDWDNQPDPDRRYTGARQILLPRDIEKSEIDFFNLVDFIEGGTGCGSTAPGIETPQPADLNVRFLSQLLFFSMAVSAWKQIVGTNHRWALRVNPSSGNLHPTEVHIAIDAISGLDSGLYHYRPLDHSLERRCEVNPFAANMGRACVFLFLTSIFWRESWKYRQRAFRYCQHDLGHALSAISLSAGLLGWRVESSGEFVDDNLRDRLGLKGADEAPMLLLGLYPADRKAPGRIPLFLPVSAGALQFAGQANDLSGEVVGYEPIEEIYLASKREDEAALKRRAEHKGDPENDLSLWFEDQEFFAKGKLLNLPHRNEGAALATLEPAQSLIRRRRSCLSLDGTSRMPLSKLSTILSTATQSFQADFNANGCLVKLFVYLHRIDGADQGLYVYDPVLHCLIQLAAGNAGNAAKSVSCFQDIASDGCLAVSMVADLIAGYKMFGDRGYRYLHYQAGYIGQLLYLSSLALGYESTGIGCFVDHEINQLFRLKPGCQVIYNFTIGTAVADPRLTNLAAYDFLSTEED